MDGEKVKWPAGGVGGRLWLAVNALEEAGEGRWEGNGQSKLGSASLSSPALARLSPERQNADSAYFAATKIVCKWAQRRGREGEREREGPSRWEAGLRRGLSNCC